MSKIIIKHARKEYNGVAVIPDFCEEVGYLLKQLRSKING